MITHIFWLDTGMGPFCVIGIGFKRFLVRPLRLFGIPGSMQISGLAVQALPESRTRLSAPRWIQRG